MMKKVGTFVRSFQYISDLHLEQRTQLVNIPVISKNIVLAGDIGDPFKPLYKEYLKFCSFEYENTFLITGNHEYWNTCVNDLTQVDDQINSIVENFDNIHFLKNKVVETDNVCFIGCTLWSKILNKTKKLDVLQTRGGAIDKRMIKHNNKFATLQDLNKFHENDVKWLENTLRDIRQDKHIVVITHHLPTFKLMHPKYKKAKNLDKYYTDLEYLIKKPILAWIGGHSHCNMEIDLNEVKLKIAAFGYPNDYEKYYLKHKIKSVDCSNCF